MESEKKLKIVIGVLLLGLVLGGGCVCFAFSGFLGLAIGSIDEGLASQREGVDYGASRTIDDCAVEGRRRALECGQIEFDCLANSTDFTVACLGAVRSPDLSLCEGAPAHPPLGGDMTYGATVCEHYGHSFETDLGCPQVALAFEEFCVVHAPRTSP